MKKVQLFVWVIVLSLSILIASPITVSAGKKVVITKPISSDDEGLNQADWNITEDSVVRKGNTIVIVAENATSDTKLISMTNAKASSDVDNIALVSANVKITALPKGERLAFALGLASIESGVCEEGNIEIFFKNDGGIKAGIEAFTEDGTVKLLAPKSCGLALNSNFTIKLVLSASGYLEAMINNTSVGSFKLPVSGEGRFGILQTGSCGAVISDLTYTCNYYETPENTDIFEDFEKGEFNANLFVSSSNDNGIFPSGVMIEEYKGSKVLRFKNTKLAHFCTLHQYSNFEISFDVPYFSRQYFYDEYGNVIGKPCSNLAVGFGEETSTPIGYSYVTDVDLIRLASQTVNSVNQEAFRVELNGTGITDLSTNEGYSFKLRVVDGHYEVFLKSLTATEYKLVATTSFEAQRSGYINIWSTGNGDFSIDNLKITNLDKNPNKIKVEYKSSLLKAEDYIPSKEENEKVFRPVEASEKSILQNNYFVLDLCLISVAIVLFSTGLVFYFLRKHRKTGGNNEND